MRIPIHLRLAGTYVLVAGIALAIGGGLTERQVAEEMRQEIALRVRQNAQLLAAELHATGGPSEAAADDWADARGAMIASRVTLIARDGRVLGDSSLTRAEVAALENHAARAEVAQASESGLGESVRYSTTLGTSMLYVAAQYPGGIVRVAMPLDRVGLAVSHVRAAIAAGLVFALGAAAVLAYTAGRVVSRPLREMTAAALDMARGRFDRRVERGADDELADLAKAINQVAGDLDVSIARLRDEGARLRAVLDGMAEGVMVTDHEGRIALANAAFGRLFPTATPLGRLPLEVVRSAALQEAIGRPPPADGSGGEEITITLPDDRTFIVRLAYLPPSPGASRRIVAVFNDVTALRRAERMRRDFVANASHELRTPIATVRAAAETMHAEEALPSNLTRFVEIIERQSERMGRLVDDMLRLSELESSYKPQGQPVDVAQIADQVLAAARARLGDRAPTLDKHIPPGLRAFADPPAVEQILTNLVENACKYTPKAGTVTIRAHSKDRIVLLEVVDTGAGIGREHLPRLFERFYRVDAGRAREHGGTGLGLAIVKHLALANHGDVAVESQPGRGSTFSVRLPQH
jgi:two-component system phosphate regulon sensor histidine kinase PhoR